MFGHLRRRPTQRSSTTPIGKSVIICVTTYQFIAAPGKGKVWPPAVCDEAVRLVDNPSTCLFADRVTLSRWPNGGRGDQARASGSLAHGET